MHAIIKAESETIAHMMEKQPATFTFINLSEPKQGKDEDLRKLIRSNAMRSYRWKQKQKQKAVKFQMRKGPITAPLREKDRPRLLPDASEQLELSQLSQLQNSRSDWPEDSDMSLLEAQQLSLPESESIAERDDQNHDYLLFTHCGEPFIARPKLALSSRKLFGDGLNDPFNAYPIGGCPRYNSYVLNHFVSVITKNCLPIEPGNGQNPLTKVWVPYAMTDPVLFLATLNFAAVHLDLLRGTQNNHKTLIHKGETIRRINARLQSSTEMASNTTIGAVAMLAAMESVNGNCKDLRIHMDALAEMVKMRGGLQGLGWSGVLHMFISWQDLISSAMMASPPHFPRTPCGLVINGDLPYSNLAQVSAYTDNTTELCAEMPNIFQNMRYLADSLGTWGSSISMKDLMSFSKQRSTLEHRLLSMKIRKPKAEMRNLDYLLEACRLAALIFVKCILHNFKPVCGILRNLKEQLINLAAEAEESIIEDRGSLRRGTMTWILFMGGILSLNSTEEDFFAERIAKSTEAWHREGTKSWADMEMWLKDIAWIDSLRTPECVSLWNRAQTLSGKDPGAVDPCTVPVHRCFSC